MHFRARSYDPRLGRFIQKDPPLERRVTHHYLYTSNTPANRRDPTGLWDEAGLVDAFHKKYGDKGLKLLAYAITLGYSVEKKTYRVSGWDVEGNVIGIAENEGFLFQDEASNEQAAEWLHSALKSKFESKFGEFLKGGTGVYAQSIIGADKLAKADPTIAKKLAGLGWDNEWGKIEAEASRQGAFMQAEAGGTVTSIVLGYIVAPRVFKALQGLGKAGHHPVPKFLGGLDAQSLAKIPKAAHKDLHELLHAALKKQGFELSAFGGKGSSIADWAAYLERNPGMQRKAFDTVLDVTRAVDMKHGTNITQEFWKNIMLKNFRDLQLFEK